MSSETVPLLKDHSINQLELNTGDAKLSSSDTAVSRSSQAGVYLRTIYHPRALFRRKPVKLFLEERSNRGGKEGSGLAESLGLIDLLGYGIGCTVGAGIYSQIGIGAGIAGPAVTIAFAIGAISCVFTALSYCEFSARVPVTGSAYTFAYASFGELFGWMIGWDLTLEYCISAAAIARSWGDYFTYFWSQWGLDAPEWLNSIPLGSTTLSPAAAAIVIMCTLVMLFGIKTSSTFNVIMTILNIFVLLFFIFVGATRVQPHNWTENNGYVPYGASSVFVAAGTLFFSYLGFDMISSLAEETKNPQKNIPRGIMGSLVIAVSIYVGVSIVATGMVPFLNLKSSNAPLASAMVETGLPWAGKVISIGSLLGLTTTTFTCLLGQPRIFYTMARDGLLFPIFKWTTSTTEIPLVGTLLTGAFTAILAFFMSLHSLSDAISIGTLIAFNLVDAGVMVVRYAHSDKYPLFPVALIVTYVISCFLSATSFVRKLPWPLTVAFSIVVLLLFIGLCIYHFLHKFQNIPETFRCPFVPFVPCIGIAINSYMLAGLSAGAWIRLGVWLLIGLLIYFLYGIRKSKMRYYLQKMTKTSVN